MESNKKGNITVRKIVKTATLVLVCVSLTGVAVGAALRNQQKENIAIRAKHNLPIELEQGMNLGVFKTFFREPDGEIGKPLELNEVKQLFAHDPKICERQVAVGCDSNIFSLDNWDDCVIVNEDGVMMVAPVPKSKDKTESNNNVKRLLLNNR